MTGTGLVSSIVSNICTFPLEEVECLLAIERLGVLKDNLDDLRRDLECERVLGSELSICSVSTMRYVKGKDESFAIQYGTKNLMVFGAATAPPMSCSMLTRNLLYF